MTSLALGPDAACIERDPAALTGAWSALADQRSEPSIFLTPEWLSVARAHDAGTSITLAIGDPVRGIAALARDPDGAIRFAGGELTDLQDVVAAPGTEAAAAGALGRWLARERPPCVRLSFVFEDSPTLPAVATELTRAGYAVTQRRLVTSPSLPLPADFETYVQSLGKKERHELRRKLRRLETTATASYRTVSDAERPAVLDRFFELHRLSHGRKADFMTPPVERFFRDVAEALAPLGRLRLGALHVDGTDVAILFGFAYRQTLALYNAAYDPGLSSLSIGIASHAWAIRDAIAEGMNVYDLLRGDEPYKYDLGARDRYLAELLADRVPA
ncbi:MAG: GNAT family N-acetyltransferase [Chloroflexi bacterium]|nr:GNAT family N-acetyltransferase [Chloroflexota bacterium]